MKPKQTLILGLVVAFAIAGIVLYQTVWVSRQKASLHANLAAFPNLDIKLVKSIELRKGIYSATLAKQGDRWLVASEGDYPADTEGITQALDAAQSLKLSDLASAKSKTHELFEVTEDKGLKVALKDGAGKVLAEFLVGKRGESYGTAYFRPAGNDSTYLIAKNLSSIFDRSSDTWKDKAIADFEVAEVRGVVIKGEKETLTLQKNVEKDAWELVEGATRTPANKGAVEDILRGISAMRTLEFPKVELKEAGLDQPGRSVSVRLQDNTEIALQAGKADSTDNRFYLKRADQPAIFMVSKYQVDNLFKTKDQLTAKEEPTPGGGSPIPLPPPNLGK